MNIAISHALFRNRVLLEKTFSRLTSVPVREFSGESPFTVAIPAITRWALPGKDANRCSSPNKGRTKTRRVTRAPLSFSQSLADASKFWKNKVKGYWPTSGHSEKVVHLASTQRFFGLIQYR